MGDTTNCGNSKVKPPLISKAVLAVEGCVCVWGGGGGGGRGGGRERGGEAVQWILSILQTLYMLFWLTLLKKLHSYEPKCPCNL